MSTALPQVELKVEPPYKAFIVLLHTLYFIQVELKVEPAYKAFIVLLHTLYFIKSAKVTVTLDSESNDQNVQYGDVERFGCGTSRLLGTKCFHAKRPECVSIKYKEEA